MDIEQAKAICGKAVNKYGHNIQIDMAIEECSELIQALCKSKRGYDNKENIREEIADVSIMLEQLKLIYGLTDEKDIVPMIKQKLRRMIGIWEAELCSTSELIHQQRQD